MKKFKKKWFLFLCIPLVIAGSIFSVFMVNKMENNNISHEFVVDVSEKNYRKVYLLDENKFLIPLSVDVSKKQYLVDEIYTIVSDLRDLKVEGFYSVLAEDVKINKIELENGILNIDFSKEFLNYQIDLEEKILEALTWSVMDFKEVEGLTISVDGVKLTKMPLNGLKLPSVLNKDIGINKYHDMAQDHQDSDDVVVLYQKNIGNNVYYVPVTRKVIKEESVTQTVINALDTNIALMSGLTKVDELDRLSNRIECDDITVSVNLDQTYLVEDNMIDSRLFELLTISLEYNNLDLPISFYIEEESVSVNGYYYDSEEVNSIVFNEIVI